MQCVAILNSTRMYDIESIKKKKSLGYVGIIEKVQVTSLNTGVYLHTIYIKQWMCLGM